MATVPLRYCATYEHIVSLSQGAFMTCQHIKKHYKKTTTLDRSRVSKKEIQSYIYGTRLALGGANSSACVLNALPSIWSRGVIGKPIRRIWEGITFPPWRKYRLGREKWKGKPLNWNKPKAVNLALHVLKYLFFFRSKFLFMTCDTKKCFALQCYFKNAKPTQLL